MLLSPLVVRNELIILIYYQFCLTTPRCSGPCKASRPQLEEMAQKSTIPMAIVHEDCMDVTEYGVKAFPTYIAFQDAKEVGQVRGANFPEIQKLMDQLQPSFGGSGQTLGSSAGTGKSRLVDGLAASSSPAAAHAPAAATPPAPEDLLKRLVEEFGFPEIRAKKGLKHGGGTIEGAVEWISNHQDDMDIDEEEPEGTPEAKSYKCNECGKIISNVANLELHASKTGHADFSESTEEVKPLTPEEKAAKVAEIKALVKAKRAERDEKEKADNSISEIQRRSMGKQMAKTREQMEIDERKRANQLRKKEKLEEKRERERLRMELAKDKAERMANKGKLSSKLGVDGYNPDAIQYDGDGDTVMDAEVPKKRAKVDAAKIDDYISKVSSYRAGGDGAKCLKVLKAYVGNLVDHPDDERFRSINMENKAYIGRVKPFIGAKNLLMAIGFKQEAGSKTLVMEEVNGDLLASTREKLEKALQAFG